jgi:hypothetical protein
VQFTDDDVTITDKIPQQIPVKRLSVGCDATSIYVANSNVYQEATVRIPWHHANRDLVEQIRKKGAIWRRKLVNTKLNRAQKTVE